MEKEKDVVYDTEWVESLIKQNESNINELKFYKAIIEELNNILKHYKDIIDKM